jgi:hypothetical protein
MSRRTNNVVAATKAFEANSRKVAASDGGSYISYLKMLDIFRTSSR